MEESIHFYEEASLAEFLKYFVSGPLFSRFVLRMQGFQVVLIFFDKEINWVFLNQILRLSNHPQNLS